MPSALGIAMTADLNGYTDDIPLGVTVHFKPELKQSKGASVRGTASQRLTAESAAPAASVCSMECFMTSHACLALPLPLSLLTHVTLLPNPTPIAQAGTI